MSITLNQMLAMPITMTEYWHHSYHSKNPERPPLCFPVLRCVAWRLHTWIHTYTSGSCVSVAHMERLLLLHTDIRTYINGSCVTIYKLGYIVWTPTGHEKQNSKQQNERKEILWFVHVDILHFIFIFIFFLLLWWVREPFENSSSFSSSSTQWPPIRKNSVPVCQSVL